MLKKLTALSLSLLICLSLLPGKAAAMDVPENETPVQAEDVDQISPEDAGAGIAPCMAVANTVLDDVGGVPAPRPAGPGANDQTGAGRPFGPVPGGTYIP